MATARPLLALAFVGGVGSATAADDSAEWLLAISEAARHRNYQGVIVYREADMLETLRVVHRHHNGREQERLTSLSGEPRDIFREDEHVTCIVPKGQAHDHAHDVASSPKSLFPAMSRETLIRAAEHYDFRELGAARVAGRTCRGVALVPRDEFRYGYRVCADMETAVPLKVSLLDHSGRVIEQMMFTEVQFPKSIPDRAFVPPPGVRAHAPAAADAGPAPGGEAMPLETWALNRLPPGFRVTHREARPTPGGMVEHVLLSDGLSAVSVFRVRNNAAAGDATPKLFSGLSNMGAMHAYGRVVGRFHVTVVGEVPRATVRMIGDGLEAEGGDDAGTDALPEDAAQLDPAGD